MLALVLAILGIAGTALTYWVQTARVRKRERILHEVWGLEHEIAEGLAQRDMDRVGRANERLRVLRQTHRGLSARQ